MNKIALVEVRDGEGPSRLQQRSQMLQRLAPALGLELSVLSKAAVLSTAPGAEPVASALAGASAVWWSGRIVFLPESKPLHQAILGHLEALGLSIPVYDTPEAVDASFDLSHFYPRFEARGIPQPQTQFLPLTEAQAQLPAPELRAVLEPHAAAYQLEGQGCFVRTYYGTRKVNPWTHCAFSVDDALNRGVALIEDLRESQSIGGLAFRELLDIASVQLDERDYFLSREFRVFVSWGQPLMWLSDAGEALLGSAAPETIDALCDLSPEQLRQIGRWSRWAAELLEARLVVLDFAITSSGQLLLLEANPGHCSGWAFGLAFLGVYGQFFRQMLGLPLLSTDAILDLARSHGIADHWAGWACGFLHE